MEHNYLPAIPPLGYAPQKPRYPPRKSSWGSNYSASLPCYYLKKYTLQVDTIVPWRTFSGWFLCRTQRWLWRRASRQSRPAAAGRGQACRPPRWTRRPPLVRKRQTLPLLRPFLPAILNFCISECLYFYISIAILACFKVGSTRSSPSGVTATVTAANRKERGTEASRSARQAALMQVATRQPPSCI